MLFSTDGGQMTDVDVQNSNLDSDFGLFVGGCCDTDDFSKNSE
jgi:hypothetical protein